MNDTIIRQVTFHRAVGQLILLAVVAGLSIMAAMVVDSMPVTADSNSFRLFFGIFLLLYMPKKCNHMSRHMPQAFGRP